MNHRRQITAQGGNFSNFLGTKSAELSILAITLLWGLRLSLAALSVFALECCYSPAAIRTTQKVTFTSGEAIRTLDIFFFTDDSLGRLDSYQRFSSPVGETVTGACTRGRRIVSALANSHNREYTWSDVNSHDGLLEVVSDLRDENPRSPLLRGESLAFAGDDRMTMLSLSPLLCEVVLQRLSCDFSGRSYAGAEITGLKAYLTNVNALCPVFGESSGNPVDILNRGRLRESDLEQMACPEMLSGDIGDMEDDFILYPDLRLYCYPNRSAGESLGSPFTRLVIQGEVDGRVWYWPLDIGRNGDGGGVEGGCSYSFDVTLTRLGVEDPDTPVQGVAAEVAIAQAPWKTLDDRYIDF